jgi:hypothetical protein
MSTGKETAVAPLRYDLSKNIPKDCCLFALP